MNKPHILREYLFYKGMRIKDLAEIIGYTPIHISNYLNGKHGMSQRCADKIEEATKGKVKAKDLMDMRNNNSPKLRKPEIAKKL
jgi:plasmid maintenance system antidote protein VapI